MALWRPQGLSSIRIVPLLGRPRPALFFYPMLPEWLKFKKYPHIGEPLTSKRDAGWVMEYVQDKDKVATHKFTPLLHKTISQRKFRPNKDASKNKFGKRIRSVQKKKVRPIFYASHIDSMLYSYYSFLLANAYED